VAWNFDFMPCPGLYNEENFQDDHRADLISCRKISGQQTQRREALYKKAKMARDHGTFLDPFCPG